ncbi:FadR/GntR family transcriptional regulator [Agromyces salentinus]|uniref:FCD domain-containing protein n=1 Tax=Agromyces salentinus TaxID=269421 RepID=A0ABN2MWW0_9MICO|nr:FCD domain-containing protein [Agromyces salentinus]
MTDDAESPRAWRAVLEHIERRLLDGDLLPGDRLPGERALAVDLGVGRSSVREALRVLEVMGLIRTASGSGPTAGAIIVATPGGAMSALMRLQVAAHGFPVADIVRTRLILESAVAGELAESAAPASATSPDLTAAERLLDAMDSPDLAAAEFLALDAAFHLALAEASGNQVVTATMAGLRSGIEGYALDGLARIDDWHATSARLRREHRGVVDAIRAADAAAARTRIHDHISGYYAETSEPDARTAAAAPHVAAADATSPEPDPTPAPAPAPAPV